MTRSRIIRLLRSAVSAACLIVCVAIIALWVRSFYYRDVLGGVIWSHVIAVESADGNIAFNSYYLNPTYTSSPWGVTSYNRTSNGFGVRITPHIFVKDWAVLLLFGVLAALPWVHHIKWAATPGRFALRDMFILTTLVAVVLGLAVAMG